MRRLGEENMVLKGDVTQKCGVSSNQYALVHNWLRRKYGAAHKCENPECGGKSKGYHYALLKGKEYKKDRANFIMLCRSCHTKYDWDNEKHTALWVVTPERRKNCSIAKTGTKASPTTLEKMSKRMSGAANPMYGVRFTKENNHFYGKRHTDEAKQKIFAAQAELSQDQVAKIREMYNKGIRQSEIASLFSINRPRVNKIVNYKIYKLW